MKPLTESDVHSAYLDADGSLYLYDRAGNNLEGWPIGWPEKIGCPSTFLKERCIWMVNNPRQMSLPEQVAAQLAPECLEDILRQQLSDRQDDFRLNDALAKLREAEAAIAELNQRLIDRTTGFMQTLGQQSLEIATLKRELRAQESVMQNYRANVSSALDLANAPTHHPATEAPHRKPMMPNERIIALAAQRDEFRKIVFDSHREAHELAIAMHRNYYMETAPQWEPLPEVPGLISQIDNMYAGVRGKHEEALAALRQAYVHNQNMHCFQTKGLLNDQLNEQTHVLRKALGIPETTAPTPQP